MILNPIQGSFHRAFLHPVFHTGLFKLNQSWLLA
jgi:hypothetical protein